MLFLMCVWGFVMCCVFVGVLMNLFLYCVLACDVCLLVLLFVFLCFAVFFLEAGGGLCVVCHLGHLLASWWNFGGAMVSSLHFGGPWGSMLAAGPHLELHLDTVGSFCTPLGSIWFPFGPPWIPFWCTFATLGPSLGPLGSLWGRRPKTSMQSHKKGYPK